MGKPANYRVVEDSPEKLVLVDMGPWDQHLTITNDAERVIKEVSPLLHGRRLFYFDSENEFTELDVKSVLGQMSFTDEDLKRYKNRPQPNYETLIPNEKLDALLARLEAAELTMEQGTMLRGYLGLLASDAFEHGALEVWDRRYDFWRKAAGK